MGLLVALTQVRLGESGLGNAYGPDVPDPDPCLGSETLNGLDFGLG